MEYCYAVVQFSGSDIEQDARVPNHCVAGIFLDKQKAVDAVLASTPHEVWEWHYGVICIEKQRLNSLGHPSVVGRGRGEENLWFLWHFDEKSQDGKYLPCGRPAWAEGLFGFI